MDLDKYMTEKKLVIEAALERFLPPADASSARLHESMRYSVFAGGKRLRPILCIAAVEALGKDPAPCLPAACALELVHTYSLIHDDLPAMDNDDLRRGKPTNHKVFGEAVAILAGDALLTLAFELVAGIDAPAAARVDMVRMLARCGGTEGLVGGQALDLSSEGKQVSEATLERIHARKTAALIETAIMFGAVCGGASPGQSDCFSAYGHALGMAFQITDDILDATGHQEKMGKRTRRDADAGKATYPARYGVDASRRFAAGYVTRAVGALAGFDERAWVLREIARPLATRDR
ncbi:MAG: polyprenyl synthetase family protein [Candidatus Aureabacteria bacterium]|nr:polyprenyl synthetase family protein [Candidatus Auribacterota bacterium]